MARVEIYTTMMCPFCFAAKRLLKDKGVRFVEFDATFKPGLRREMIERADGRTSVPQIFVDDAHIGDCNDIYALDREGRLDAILGGTG
jgi:glutaredoxin 3